MEMALRLGDEEAGTFQSSALQQSRLGIDAGWAGLGWAGLGGCRLPQRHPSSHPAQDLSLRVFGCEAVKSWANKARDLISCRQIDTLTNHCQ